MYTTRALQAGAHGFAVGKLDFDTYDRMPLASSWGWVLVGLRTFQGSSCRVILSSSRLYLELRLPADQSTVPKSRTVILVLLGDFGGSCFSLFCLGLHGVTNHFLLSLSASIVPAQGSDGRCCDPSSSLLQGTHLGGLTPAIAITALKCLLGVWPFHPSHCISVTFSM